MLESVMPTAPSDDVPMRLDAFGQPNRSACTLDCRYCHFLAHVASYRGGFRFDSDPLETHIRQVLEAHQAPVVTITWVECEPTLMKIDCLERAVELVEKHRKAGQQIEHMLPTNGILPDHAWCNFFKRHHFRLDLNIDGPRSLPDIFKDRRKSETLGEALRLWKQLTEHGIEFNVLCSVHAGNVRFHQNVYRFFRDDLRAKRIQFIPIVEHGSRCASPPSSLRKQNDKGAGRSVRAEQFGDFLISIFDEWVRHDVGKVCIEIFDSTLEAYLGQNGVWASTPSLMGPNHKLHKMEPVQLTCLSGFQLQSKLNDMLPRYCRTCDVRFACNGGFPKHRFLSTPDGEPGLNCLCAGYKKFFLHVDQPMRMMANLIYRGFAPAEIMHRYAAADERWRYAAARIGMDKLCPCGSGKKSKWCHLKPEASRLNSHRSA